jgi:hypothetical protein
MPGEQPVKVSEDVVDTRGPFIVTQRDTLYDNWGRRVHKDQATNSTTGGTEERVWLEFTRPAVMVFPMDLEGNIYLMREFVYTRAEWSIEAAGGAVRTDWNPPETLEGAAQRLVKNELGIIVPAESLIPLGHSDEITSVTVNRTHLYEAQFGSLADADPALRGTIRMLKVPFSDALDMHRRREITNGVVRDGISEIAFKRGYFLRVEPPQPAPSPQ